jgi:ATP-dependent HslUV protease ATP-binding subunit HslU
VWRQDLQDENISACHLHTVMEKLLEEISFGAVDKPGTRIVVDAAYVREHVGALTKNADLSKFVL